VKIEHPPHQSLVMPSKLLTENKPYTHSTNTDLAKLFAAVRDQMRRQAIPDPWDEVKPPQWWVDINGVAK
jgi:hypothetical protein